MYFMGIDHHKRDSQVVVMDEQGTVRLKVRLANERAAFATLKERLAPKPGSILLLA